LGTIAAHLLVRQLDAVHLQIERPHRADRPNEHAVAPRRQLRGVVLQLLLELSEILRA
jgi:hypothetical protein